MVSAEENIRIPSLIMLENVLLKYSNNSQHIDRIYVLSFLHFTRLFRRGDKVCFEGSLLKNNSTGDFIIFLYFIDEDAVSVLM